MNWGEEIKCHAAEAGGSVFKMADKIVWREPVIPTASILDDFPRIQPYPTCGWCGGISPKALYELDQRFNFGRTFIADAGGAVGINPAPHVELADQKYGFPHKLYVTTHETLWPEMEFVIGKSSTGEVQTRKGWTPHIKFYNVHLNDCDEEALAAIAPLFARALCRKLSRDERGTYLTMLDNPLLARGTTEG